MKKKIKGTLAGALIFSVLVCLWIGMQGCAGVKVNTVNDPEIRDALLKETGFTIAYYTLLREQPQTVDRIKKSVETAFQMLHTKNVGEVIKLVIAYIQDFPQWKTGHENYDVLIVRAVNVLTILIEVDLTVPEKYETARRGVTAFLLGAEEGIEAIKAESSKIEAFLLSAFSVDLLQGRA